jgi:glycosyltransferase involved in cell wall biosynthesis
MKIAFYLDFLGNRTVDVSSPELGNPGIGGTSFQMILLGHFLSMEKADWQIYFLAENDVLLSEKMNFVKINEINLLDSLIFLDIDILVVPNSRFSVVRNLNLSEKIKIVTRSGNTVDFANMRWIERNKNVRANVFVGKQFYDYFLDCDIIEKSKYIYNITVDPCSQAIKRDIDSKTVVYMGALVKAKGFLELAKIWKPILRNVPNARLFVIGSGKLYNSDKELGSLGLAEKHFEDEFLPYISDKNGVLPSVKFLGVLGKEKYDIFSKASVGVANPSGISETFCSTVIKMNCASLPVVTINKFSFPDVITSGQTGLLGKNNAEIKKHIIRLLRNNELNKRLGLNAKEYVKKFSPQRALFEWIKLFEEVHSETFKPVYDPPIPPFNNRYKWLRIINRFLRVKCNLAFLPAITTIKPQLSSFLKGSR